MKGKKSLGLEFYMLIVAIFVGLGFFYDYSLQKEKFEGFIGQHNFYLQDASNKAEKAGLYMEESAKYALQQSVYDLAQTGGFSETRQDNTDESFGDYKCGKFNGAFVWFEMIKDKSGYNENDCLDERSLNTHLAYYFDVNFKNYLSKYYTNLPSENYDYSFTDNLEVAVKSLEQLKIDILNYISYESKDKTSEASTKPGEELTITIDSGGNPVKTTKGTEIKSGEKVIVDFTSVKTTKIKQDNKEVEVDLSGICAGGGRCILTKEAYDLLARAEQIARQRGQSLEIKSSLRDINMQKALWDGKTSQRYAQRYPDPKIRRKYVCDPYTNNGQGCPHLTGNAVDIRLKNRPMNARDWKILEDIMTDAGWVRYANELWHFECCGTPRYARAQQQGKKVIV